MLKLNIESIKLLTRSNTMSSYTDPERKIGGFCTIYKKDHEMVIHTAAYFSSILIVSETFAISFKKLLTQFIIEGYMEYYNKKKQ